MDWESRTWAHKDYRVAWEDMVAFDHRDCKMAFGHKDYRVAWEGMGVWEGMEAFGHKDCKTAFGHRDYMGAWEGMEASHHRACFHT